MGKRCPEDFNPWPPFVDIFASVILVLMLFLLITIVNIGYYAQFKSVTSYTAYSETKAPVVSDDITPVATTCIPRPKTIEQKDELDMISFHKIAEPQSTESNNSLFSGGQAVGNAVMYAREKIGQEFTKQQTILKERSIEIFFEDKEIFINSRIKYKIKKFVGDINRMTRESEFTIYVRDPDNIISATLSKQVSLGRVLNIKSLIKKSNIKPKRIKINLQEQVSVPSKYGSLVIKAYIP